MTAATDVSTHAAERIDQQRHADVALAAMYLANGDTAAALECMKMTVELQALLAGCGYVNLPRAQGVAS